MSSSFNLTKMGFYQDGLDQYRNIVNFLIDDYNGDSRLLEKNNYLTWRMRFGIRRQMRKTLQQIKHYRHKISRYKSEGWTD